MEELIKKICLEKLAERITQLSGKECKPEIETVLLNLGYLATEIVEFGDKKRFIPLNLKEIILSILYQDFHIDSKLTHDQDKTFWECETNIYLHKEDQKPAGVGRFAYTLKQYCQDNGFEEEIGICSIGNWVRGLSKTRAIQAALPFLNLYCDEDLTGNESGIPQGELPKPKSQEEKKEENRKKDCEKQEEQKAEKKVEAENEPITNAIQTTLEQLETQIPCEEKEKNEETEKSVSNDTTATATSMTLEQAFEVVADVGNCKGYSLKEIYERQPRNIIWLYGKGNSAHKEALKMIIESDPDLKKYIA